jgi:hypothetical protein
MKTLAVAAGAIHGLSLAVAYGGPVFAKVGLKRALKHVASKDERRAVMQTAWDKFSKVNVPAHVGFTASWVILRSMTRNLHVNRQTKNLMIAKDVLIAGALITGVAATITGKAMKRALAARATGTTTTKPTESEKPAAGKEKPSNKSESTTAGNKQYNKLLRLEKKLGRANMAFLAGAIIISPAIGVGLIRARRMGLLGRLFNR